MLPFFEFFGMQIFTFGLTIILWFFMFIFMMKKLSVRLSFDFVLFKKNLLWFFIGTFFFSRLFYVIAKWSDLKYIENPMEFFIMNEYNFSLVWMIFWFFTVLFITTRLRKENINNFIDGIVISLFFVLTLGYIGAFLGWEVYWKETHFWIELLYTHPYSPIPYKVPVFPLPIVYALISFLLFSASYILSMYVHIKAIIWYVGLIIFSCVLLILEFFSGKTDIFNNIISINMVQIFAFIAIGICSYKLYEILHHSQAKDQQILKH